MYFIVIKLFSSFDRVNSLSHCLSTLHKFVDLYQDIPASFEVFAPVKEHLQRYLFIAWPHIAYKHQNLPQTSNIIELSALGLAVTTSLWSNSACEWSQTHRKVSFYNFVFKVLNVFRQKGAYWLRSKFHFRTIGMKSYLWKVFPRITHTKANRLQRLLFT